MTHNELLKTRIKKLNEVSGSSVEGECVLYIMSRDQRVQDNHALLAAQKHAIAKELPLCVVFCLYDKAKGRAREHYQFMIDGLYEVESQLRDLNIAFMMLFGSPTARIGAVIHHTKPEAVYFDFNPLRGPQSVSSTIAAKNEIPVYIVDTHNMIPIWETSEKREIGARTIRQKIHKNFAKYLQVPGNIVKHPYSWPGEVKSMTELTVRINQALAAQRSNGTTISYKSGEKFARIHLNEFIRDAIGAYSKDRNDPSYDALSGLSPYLHFGQLSSLRVAIEMGQLAGSTGHDLHLLHSGKMPQSEDAPTTKIGSANALLEEIIVRKELSDNFCYYEDSYDTIGSADKWAKATIQEHDEDTRDYLYSYEDLENAKTHDAAWNAAQSQMVKTGKMHGYMRMYWAKKIKEWTADADTAVTFAIKLNDFYSIDGGDPNGYVGILWSIAGVHDRAWTEREVFGKIRYMNYGGLKRKFNIENYEKQWLQ
jgi:deoxyribodipyrimidine photo-lyase